MLIKRDMSVVYCPIFLVRLLTLLTAVTPAPAGPPLAPYFSRGSLPPTPSRTFSTAAATWLRRCARRVRRRGRAACGRRSSPPSSSTPPTQARPPRALPPRAHAAQCLQPLAASWLSAWHFCHVARVTTASCVPADPSPTLTAAVRYVQARFDNIIGGKKHAGGARDVPPERFSSILRPRCA